MGKALHCKLLFTASLILLLAGIPAILHAQKTWNGGAGNVNWNDAGNWNPAGVPLATDNVIIPGGVAVVVNINNAVCQSLVLNAGNNTSVAQLSFANATSQLTVAGALTLGASQGQSRRGAVSMTNGGRLIVQSLSAPEPTSTFTPGTGTVEVTGAASVTLPATVFTAFNNIVFSGVGTKTAGRALVITGDLTINSGSTFSAGGFTHSVAGNWTNNGNFAAATSTVVFDGTGVQTVSGTGTNTFNNLRVNKTAGNMVLGAPVAVAGQLGLFSGIVNTTATNILTLQSTGGIEGSPAPSNAAHINGPMERVGVSGFTFPIGKNGKYNPLTISAPTGGSPGVHTFRAEYFAASARSLGPVTASGLVRVSNCEYWNLQRTGGTLPVDVTLNWGPNIACATPTYISEPASIVVAQFNTNGTNSWSAFGGSPDLSSQTPPGTGTVTIPNVSSFGDLTFGTTSAANALPIVFANLTATQREGDVLVSFSNMTEERVAGYYIERAVNGVDFSVVGTLAPRHNGNSRVDYTFLDRSPNNGNNFYRIRGVETTGKTVYSAIVKLQAVGIGTELSIVPNPARVRSAIHVQMGSLPAGRYQIRIFNQVGQLVHTAQFSHTGGTVSTPLPSERMQAGRYILELNGGLKRTRSFLIQ